MINIIYPEDGWILEKMAKELFTRIPDTRAVPFTTPGLYDANGLIDDDDVDLNYYINYALFTRKSKNTDAAWFTHPLSDGKFHELAKHVDLAICNCEKYRLELSEQGSNAVTIIPGISHSFRPKLTVGFIGRFSNYGERKGENLLKLVSDLNFVELRSTNGLITENDLPDFYNQLDCVLITSKVEGGPMCLLEGLAMGKPVICPPDVGLAGSFLDQIIPYQNGDFHSLRNVLTNLYKDKDSRYQSVSEYTWENWAEKHSLVFQALLRNHTFSDWATLFSDRKHEEIPTIPHVIDEYARQNQLTEINLHLGCGGNNIEGWINIDNFDYVEGDNSRSGSNYDIKMDIRHLDVSDNLVDKILLVHVLEHFVRWQAIENLEHYFNKLKPGGLLIIEQPDLDRCIAWYQKGKDAPHINTPVGPLNMGFTQLYGNQWDKLDYETHRYVWTKNEMQTVLNQIGYKVLQLNNEAKFHQPDRDMFVIAQKP